jgi:hypothetical protein
MIPGKLYQYKHRSITVMIMEHRWQENELNDIKIGDVLLCIEVKPVRKKLRARMINSNGEMGWVVYSDMFWEMIS